MSKSKADPHEIVQPFWPRVSEILRERDKCRKNYRAAQRCSDPADAVYYNDALVNLLQLEAQVTGVCFVLCMSRQELVAWVKAKQTYHNKYNKPKEDSA